MFIFGYTYLLLGNNGYRYLSTGFYFFYIFNKGLATGALFNHYSTEKVDSLKTSNFWQVSHFSSLIYNSLCRLT